eukprot:GFKZ01000690.1.p1 GENE.GFKZ01000690.1~~GFKZ01000690.1.p1  ORF type:complete len:340 (-),score=38.95 GFKZ01000690.1:1211-2230(-)
MLCFAHSVSPPIQFHPKGLSLCPLPSSNPPQPSSRHPFSMSTSDPPQPPESPSEKRKSPEPRTHISAEAAITAMNHAISAANGDPAAVALTCARGVAEAFTQCYNLDDATGVFVVCGPGLNGLIGLQLALDLQKRGYVPAVYMGDENKYADIRSVCEQHGLDVYDFVPSTLEFYFQVIVDAFLGTGYDGGDIRPRFWNIYELLCSTRVAILSVDVPSGWDLRFGPREIDVTADTFVKPEVLVSLGAPKECAKVFSGGYHFVAGRHLPQSYFTERDIRVPVFPGDEAQSVLLSSNPFRYQGYNGEKYGKPGQFNATLFTKDPRREWVDIDNDPDLWDELD